MEAVTVATGGDALLVVALEGVKPARILWHKGGRELLNGDNYSTSVSEQAAQLVVHGATPRDSGTYTALVTATDGSQAKASVALRVAPQGELEQSEEAPVFVRTLTELASKVGTRVRFLVELRNSRNIKLYWYHKNSEAVEDFRHKLLHEGNFFCLDVNPLVPGDEGTWRCMAENEFGQTSCSAALRVVVPRGYKAPVFLEELEAILTSEGTVSLECKVVGVPTPVLKWFKDGAEIKAGDVFGLTANSSDPTSLGTYTCEAVNCMGRVVSSSRVRVASREGSLRPPSSKDRRSPSPVGPPPTFKVSLTDKKFKVGEKADLIIQVTVPPEVQSVTWYSNGRQVEASDKYRLRDEGGGNLALEISPLELGDDGEWKAVVRNEGGYSTSSCKVTLTVPRNYRIPRFLEALRALLTEEGLVSFECKVVGYPTPVLKWFKDGQELKPGDVYQLSGTNSLGKYSCIAKNCMGETSSSAELTLEDIKSHLNEDEKEHLLATNVPPRFIHGLVSRDIKIGDSFKLTVQVTATTAPSSVTWYHEDEVISESSKFRISSDDSGKFHLEITSLDISDQGEWKCMACNDFGHSVTAASIKLVIPRHYKKPVFLDPLRALLSKEGTVNLECKVIGVPQPVLKWYKDGVELQPGDIHRIISGEDGTCCLGTYTCEATNCMGSASSSAALLGFEDQLMGRDKFNENQQQPQQHDLRGVVRNPSLSTINEERSSQISVYESAEVSLVEEEDKAEVSVSIDGRDVSLSLYETPDLSEHDAKQIADMYAEEISDHLSGLDGNQAELPPLRIVKETSRKGPLIMEATVIDVENEAFDEYMSMAEGGYDDLRTEADVEELSAIEAIVVDEREALRSDIAEMPDVEIWDEEMLSLQTVSTEGRGVAYISEANIMEQELRTLSEQGLSMLQEVADGEMMCHEGIMMNEPYAAAKVGELQSKAAKQVQAQASQVPGFEVAESREQLALSSEDQLKKGVKVNKKSKRPIDVVESGELEGAETPGKPKDSETTLSEDKENKKPTKKSKKADGKKEKTAKTETVETSESTLTGSIGAHQANVVIVESCAYNIEDVEILEAAPSLKELIIQNQFAEVLEASHIEAIIQQQVNVLSDQTSNLFNLEDPVLHQAVLAQLSAAVVAQQMEQGYFSGAQDMPGAFSPEETSADFSEFHSLGEPVQCTELYGFESVEQMEFALASGQLAAPGQESYNQALEAYENQLISADGAAFSNEENTGFQMSALEAITAQDSFSQAQLLEGAQVFESSVPQARPTIEVLDQDEMSSETLITEDSASKQMEKAVPGVTEGESLSAIVNQPPELVYHELVPMKTVKKAKDKKRVSESEPEDQSSSIQEGKQETKSKKAKVEKKKDEKKDQPSPGDKNKEIVQKMEIGDEASQLTQADVNIKKDVPSEALLKNVQQAIAAKPSQLTESDSQLLQATVEQLLISDKPVEILETLDSSQKSETVVKASEVKLTPNQFELLTMIENPALDLQLAVEVTENLSEGKQIKHKVFAPKGLLAEKLAACEPPSDDGSKSVPVFEMIEVVDGGKLKQRKISVNKANILSSDEASETFDALSLAENCSATLAEAITVHSEKSSAVVAQGTVLRSGEAKQQRKADESGIASEDGMDRPKIESTCRMAIQLDSESNKKQIQQHIQEAIAHNKPDLTTNDLEVLQSALEQFILSKTPIELIESVGPLDTQFTVKQGGVQISPKQLEELKLIKNLAAELGVAVEVTEQLSEGRQVTHKVISPKSPLLLEKLIGKRSGTESNSIPVFEITEVVDDGKVTKRKISMNKVELLTLNQKANSMSEVSLADICSTAISAAITDEVADSVAVANQVTVLEAGQPIPQDQQNSSAIGKKRVAKKLSDQPGAKAVQQKQTEGPKASAAVIQELSGVDIHKDVEQAMTKTQAQLTSEDADIVQAAVQQFARANKPVNVLESMDSESNAQLILRGEVHMTSNQFDELKSLKNPAEDLQVAILVTEKLPGGKQVTHKIITPKSSQLMEKLVEQSDDPTSTDITVPVFEVTEIMKDGKMTKRKVSVNQANIISIDDTTTIVDALSISDMCTSSLAEILAEELQTSTAAIFSVQLQASKDSTDAKSKQSTNASRDAIMSPEMTSSPSQFEADAVAADTNSKPKKPIKVKKAVAPSAEIVSACEEILNSQGGTVEASDIAKYLDISATADQYLDQVIELAGDEKSGVDESKEDLLNKKKLLLQKKHELMAKQEQARKLKELESSELSGETSTADSSAVSSVIETKTGELSKDERTNNQKTATSSSSIASVDMEALDGTSNKSKKIESKFEAAGNKGVSSEMPPELAMALQSKLADAGKQAEAILLALERGIAQMASDVSDKTVGESSVESLATEQSLVLDKISGAAAGAVKPEETPAAIQETKTPDSTSSQIQQVEGSYDAASSKISSEIYSSEGDQNNFKAPKSDTRQNEGVEKPKDVDHSLKESIKDAKLISKSLKNEDLSAHDDSAGSLIEKPLPEAVQERLSSPTNEEATSKTTKVDGPPEKLVQSMEMDSSSKQKGIQDGKSLPFNEEISAAAGHDTKAPPQPTAKGVTGQNGSASAAADVNELTGTPALKVGMETNEGASISQVIKLKSMQNDPDNKVIVHSHPPSSSSEISGAENDAKLGASSKPADSGKEKSKKVTEDGKENKLGANETNERVDVQDDTSKIISETENDAEIRIIKQRKDEANQKAQNSSSSASENVSVAESTAPLTAETTMASKDTLPIKTKKITDQENDVKTVTTGSVKGEGTDGIKSDPKQTGDVSLQPVSSSKVSQQKLPGEKDLQSAEDPKIAQVPEVKLSTESNQTADNVRAVQESQIKLAAEEIRTSEAPEKISEFKAKKSANKLQSTEVLEVAKEPGKKLVGNEAQYTAAQEPEKTSGDGRTKTTETASAAKQSEEVVVDERAKSPGDGSGIKPEINAADKKAKPSEAGSPEQEPEKKAALQKAKPLKVASTEQESEKKAADKPKSSEAVYTEQELEKKAPDKKPISPDAVSTEQEPEKKAPDKKPISPEAVSTEQECEKKIKPSEVASTEQEQERKTWDMKAKATEVTSVVKNSEEKTSDKEGKSSEVASIEQGLEKKPGDKKAKAAEAPSVEQEPGKKPGDKKSGAAEALTVEQEPGKKPGDKKNKAAEAPSVEQEPEKKQGDKKINEAEAPSVEQEPEKKQGDKKANEAEAPSLEQEPEKKTGDKKAKVTEVTSVEKVSEKMPDDKRGKPSEGAAIYQELENKPVDKKDKTTDALSVDQEPEKKPGDKKAKAAESPSVEQEHVKRQGDKKAKEVEAPLVEQEPEKKQGEKKAKEAEAPSVEQEPEKKPSDKSGKTVEGKSLEQKLLKETDEKSAKQSEAESAEQDPDNKLDDNKAKPLKAASSGQEPEKKSVDLKPKPAEAESGTQQTGEENVAPESSGVKQQPKKRLSKDISQPPEVDDDAQAQNEKSQDATVQRKAADSEDQQMNVNVTSEKPNKIDVKSKKIQVKEDSNLQMDKQPDDVEFSRQESCSESVSRESSEVAKPQVKHSVTSKTTAGEDENVCDDDIPMGKAGELRRQEEILRKKTPKPRPDSVEDEFNEKGQIGKERKTQDEGEEATIEQKEKRKRKEDKLEIPKQEQVNETKAMMEEQEKHTKTEEENLKARNQELEIEEKAMAEEQEKHKRRVVEKLKARKQEQEDEERCMVEEQETRKRREKEKLRKRKQEQEEEEKAEAEEHDKRKTSEEEKLMKRKLEQENEEKAIKEEQEKYKKRQIEKFEAQKQELEDEAKAFAEEQEIRKRREEAKLKGRKEDEEKAIHEEKERRIRRDEDKLKARKKEEEEEVRAKIEEAEKRRKREEEKLRIQKQEEEEEEKARVAEIVKRKKREEEKIKARKQEQEEEEKAMMEEKIKRKRREEEKLRARKQEEENEEKTKIEETEKRKRREEEKLKALKEREEILLKEEEERQARRKKQREDKEKELREEEERLRKANEEREEKRKRQKQEEAALKKEEEAKEREKENKRLQELEKRRQELDQKHREEERALHAEEEERKEKKMLRLLAEEKALREEEERAQAEMDMKREKRKKQKEAEEQEEMKKKEAEILRKKKEEDKRLEEKKKKQKQWEEDERAFEEAETKRRESKLKRQEADKLRAQEEEMLAGLERQRVGEDKKRLEDELRRREEAKRRQEEEVRKQGEEFLRKEEERRKRRAEELKRWKDDDGGLQYTDRELIVEPLPEDRPWSRTSESGDVCKRDIRRRPKFSTKLQDRQTVKGTRVKLTCNIISSPEDPPPEVEWFKGGYPIKEDERVTSNYVDGLSSLEIRDVTRSDSGEYTCTAHNRHGRVTTSCDLRVKGEEEQKPAPPTFTTAIRERYVPEDDELVLSCHVTGFPQPKTTWLKDADKLPASPRFQSLLSEEGICTLIIKSPRTADSGVFSCHAENRVYRDEITANIQVAGNRESQRDDTEIPRFVSELCDQYVEENGTLTLQVEVAGSPAPEILWLFNGRTLTPSGKMRVSAVGQTHTLTVFQVTQKDLGTYSCRIQNPYGHAYTLSTVSFGKGRPRRFGGILKGALSTAEGEMRAPSFVERPESMLTAFRDEELTLSCTVLGEPTPRVSWLKGIHDMSNCGTSHKTVQGNTHTWTLRGVQFTDSGTYTVEAKNSHGTVRAYCSVKVKDNSRSRSYSPRGTKRFPSVSHDEDQRKMSGRFIRDVPGKVGAIRAVDVGRNWVSLRWAKPEHSGSCPVTAYKVESWILGEEARWQELAVSPICSFDVYHLKQDREYLFRVTPRNKYGWGEVEMTPRPTRIGRTIEQPILPRTLPRQVRCMPGGSVSLDAQVTGEPLPEVRWYKDGTAVDVNRYPRFSTRYTEGTIHNVFGLVHKVSLRIDDLHPEDEGKYELEAVNPGGRVSSYTRLLATSDCSVMEAHDKINSCLMALSRMDSVSSMAPQFTMRLRDRRVQVGFPVRLTCQFVGVPKPDILWFKDGNPIAPDDTHHLWQEDGHFYSIELSDSQHEDAAIYSVTATNPYGCVACKCRLVVDSGLRSYISPMFLRELEDVSVSEGETITLQTVIEAYPTIGVVWHRDGQRIRPSRKHTFDLDEDGLATLEIEGADYLDGGLYTCTATNEMGTIESICRVSVSCQQSDITHRGDAARARQCPMFLRKPRTIDAEEGDMVVIECEVAGDPKPAVTWLRDWLKPSVYSDGSRFQEVGSGPVYRLEIPKCRVEDTGAYSILAKNEHGEARAVISLQVYTKGLKGELKGGTIKRGVMEAVPRVVRPLQDVRCCDGDAVTLETLFDAPHASLVRWEKQGRVIKETSDVSSEWDGSKARLKIRSVYPEDEGEYCCIVYNDMGKAVTSAALVVEMADDKENDVTVQLEHRPDLSRRTTPSRTPSRYSRSPSIGFTREGSAHSWAGVGWREPSVSIPTWRPLSRGSSPLLFGRRYTPEPPTPRSKQRRAHGPKFYYIPHDRIVEEGETVTFQCAIKGHPTPKTAWDKDSVKLIGEGRYKMEERNEVRTIEILKVTQQDAGLYRVTIENDLGREQATARLDVIKASTNKYAGYVRNWHTSPLTAPRFTRTLPFTSIRDGSRMKLSTEFKGSPSPRAKWYRNHELLPNCPDFEQTCNSTSATLELPCVSCNDAGTYTCMIVSDRGRAQCSCQVTVEHHHNRGAAPHFTKALQHDTALDGDPLRIGVTLHGSQPMKVLWVKNDQLIEPSERVHIEADGPQPSSSPSTIEDSRHWLQFEEVIPEDSGVYFCEAYNQHGEAYSYCRLKVVDPNSVPACPPCIIGALTPLHITEGTRARFRANVRGHPTPALTWELDGQPIVPSRTVQISASESDDGLEVFLSFLCAAPSDSGTVTLHARNAAGRQSVHTTLQVIPRKLRERPSSTPRSAAEQRALPLEKKHCGSAVFRSSSSNSLPFRSISPSSRSRPPVRHHSFGVKSTRVANNNTEITSDRWSSVTGRSPSPRVYNSVESSASSNSSTTSSPRCKSPRTDSARAVSPQLTYQFKSSSASPARNTVKSRSPSPRIRQCSKTNLINSHESSQSSFKPIAQRTNSLKAAVIVKPIIPKSLSLKGTTSINSTSPSTISSPTSTHSQGPSLPTGRPPTPRSKVSTSPAPSTELRSPTLSENSQFSRSISPASSRSPSLVSRASVKKIATSDTQPSVVPPVLQSSRSPVTRSHSSRSPSSRSPVSRSPSFRSPMSRSPSPSLSNGLRTQSPISSTGSPLRASTATKQSSLAATVTIEQSQVVASASKSEAHSPSTSSQPKMRKLTRQERVMEEPTEHKSRPLSKSPRIIRKTTDDISHSPTPESPVKSQSPSVSSSPRNDSVRMTPRSSPSPRARPLLKDQPQVSSMDSAYCSGRNSSMSAAGEVDVGYREKAVRNAASNVGDASVESPAAPKTKEDENDLDAECEFLDSEDEEEGVEIVAGPHDVIVTKGQTATLTLSYNGNPPPEVTWLKKDTILRDDCRYSVRTGRGVSSLSIHNVTADDSAKYTAVVRNAISAHAGFASLSVEDVPEPPSAQPNLSEVGAGCVTLSWYGPAYDGGSVVTGYTVETRKVGQVEWTKLVSRWHSTSYKVTGQEVGGQYEYRVKAHNIHGLSEHSKSSQPITLEGTENPDGTDGINGLNGDDSEENGDDETVDFEHCCVDFQPGEVFAQRFDMHEEVGKGRFGIVYRCTDKLTSKQRAAKIIKCIQAKEKEKVREEMSIMNALRHPKLLQLAAAFERTRDVVMVMEFIAGGELFERVVADDFTLTEKDVILFMRQICEGVQYMHKNNILHLDLKPENILCVRKSSHKIKLIDFGLARRFNPAEPCRVLFGTPEFIAPEIINYEPISYSSDMWSVGVICYVLLSGLSPFMGDNDAETFANITRAEFDFDDDAFSAISEGAKGFITALLVNRKEQRLTSEQCLQHPWLTQHEGTMNKRVIPTDKLKKFIIRRKWQAYPRPPSCPKG